MALVQNELSEEQATELDRSYRADLISDLRLHNFQGIVQIKQDTRLPLADIYQELGLLRLSDERQRQEAQARILTMRQEERAAEEEHKTLTQQTWEDPRWHEVIMLAAGRLGNINAPYTTDYLEGLVKMEASDLTNEGRQVVLAGRALADIGTHGINRKSRAGFLIRSTRPCRIATQRPTSPTPHPAPPYVSATKQVRC